VLVARRPRARCSLSPSTLSRIETGSRRIVLDQLTAISRALGTTPDQLVESVTDDDVVIRPQQRREQGVTSWVLDRDAGPQGVTVAKMRITGPAPRRGTGMFDHGRQRTHLQ